jgi:hypothetical protein
MNYIVPPALTSALLLAAAKSHPYPIITLQPTNQSVSLRASAAFRVSGTTTHPPMGIRRQSASADLPLATNSTLTPTNIQTPNLHPPIIVTGQYTVTNPVCDIQRFFRLSQ